MSNALFAMSRCSDVKMSRCPRGVLPRKRCQDVKMSRCPRGVHPLKRCQDAKMSRCPRDVFPRKRYQDVKMSAGCVLAEEMSRDVIKDVKMSRCQEGYMLN